jgi:Sec-independent protein translocase protein TatA
MFDLGPEKLLFVLLVAFVVLGPKQLPDVARKVGSGMRHWQSLRESLHSQINSALDAPPIEPDTDHPAPAPDATGPRTFS